MPSDTPHEDSPQKRKRPLDDIGGDREQKKVHTDEDRRLGIENLHLDVGEKYLLCKTPHPPARPRLEEDLFEMYNLTGIAAEVARVLPNGEKNAMRKTYKGHIKKLGVNGHFDSVKKDEKDPDGFLAMLYAPELEWNVHMVKGKEIENGFSDVVRGSLGRAMTMAKGPIDKRRWDSSVLGDLAQDKVAANKQPSSAKATAPSTPAASAMGAVNPRLKAQGAAGQEAARPRRSIMKRSYGDNSFEGYGEGFPDDDGGVETGYSTGEGEGGVKRRKKVLNALISNLPHGFHADTLQNPANSQPFPGAVRQASYGPGMVGA
ncbi:putative mediator of rna polymerase ii transcription subunit 19 protein [Phaeoacremonium minimum UCRPA7]|uniref:Mediator of RNA polymerase II transcription subunit 19 n=1 Tax=Phaeoacremonium minimum (strain UCR-PA7) TaxID=1286976 RepID=R8BE26_PHAM7|nr:putative mediator of rna polymerase ii transcription subunit 19 protein [Phaeoacremonium minimum UCRPA7]EON97558.1 putative mediator of rna polymerase ii transcription subunit 19 protein [Phaeoacremonium minimum UCRPA7]